MRYFSIYSGHGFSRTKNRTPSTGARLIIMRYPVAAVAARRSMEERTDLVTNTDGKFMRREIVQLQRRVDETLIVETF